jgi:hypothetical protein
MRRFPWGLIYERTAVADMFLDHDDGSASRISPLGGEGTFLRCGLQPCPSLVSQHSDTKSARILLAWAEAAPQPVSGMDSNQARNCHACQYRAALSHLRFVVSVQFRANAGKTA